MPYPITLVDVQAHETTPAVALYTLDARGRIASKLAVASAGHLQIDAGRLPPVVAFGPDVSDFSSLDPKSLLTVRTADQLATWERNKAILIPAQWWRRWLGYLVCVSGQAFRCFPFVIGAPELRRIALGERLIVPEICRPLCNAVVEVWENTCCCWPFLFSEVPTVIANLRKFLAANPIMFPVPPRPDPGPVDRVLRSKVDSALGAGKISYQFAPNTELSQHLQTLEGLSGADAVAHIEAYPSLWPFFCHCTSSKLGETTLNPDATFSYCYWTYPLILINCRTSYFYKVRQFINGAWVYVYDGAAAHQYFTADQVANLRTLTGLTCHQQPPPPGNDIVALQAIGSTNTWDLNSHWNGASGAGVDQTQTGDTTVASPPNDAGLWTANGGPWALTLPLMLYIDPGMKALGAYYYRLSVVQADSATGGPLSGSTLQPIVSPVAWSKYVTVSGHTTIQSQNLGPNTVVPAGGDPVTALYQIPYDADADWLLGQFHQYLDTTQLANNISGGPGVGNGQFLLVLEIFDQNAKRLVPQTATTITPTDAAKPFNFIRLLSASGSNSTANVPFAALTHLIWVDNRPVVAQIDDFQVQSGMTTTIGSQECQFLHGAGGDLFKVGYRAYHHVMCDVSPRPPHTFMDSFYISWEEGLNGPSGTLASGGDTNQPNPAYPTCPGTAPEAVSPGTSFATLLAGQAACAFAITLHVSSKHTSGSGTINTYNREVTSAVALST